jgi:hypothetical protein
VSLSLIVLIFSVSVLVISVIRKRGPCVEIQSFEKFAPYNCFTKEFNVFEQKTVAGQLTELDKSTYTMDRKTVESFQWKPGQEVYHGSIVIQMKCNGGSIVQYTQPFIVVSGQPSITNANGYSPYCTEWLELNKDILVYVVVLVMSAVASSGLVVKKLYNY